MKRIKNPVRHDVLTNMLIAESDKDALRVTQTCKVCGRKQQIALNKVVFRLITCDKCIAKGEKK